MSPDSSEARLYNDVRALERQAIEAAGDIRRLQDDVKNLHPTKSEVIALKARFESHLDEAEHRFIEMGRDLAELKADIERVDATRRENVRELHDKIETRTLTDAAQSTSRWNAATTARWAAVAAIIAAIIGVLRPPW